MAEPKYRIGQRVGVALVRGSRDFDPITNFEAVITEVPEGASPYFVGTNPTGETVLFFEREIVTTLPTAQDVESVEAWLNGR